jgi:hypothetical protein
VNWLNSSAMFFVTFVSTAVSAEERATYQSLLSSVSKNADCKSSEFPDFTLYDCEKDMALWYFTKENHPANPGVIERKIEQNGQGVSVHEQGWSFAPDSEQPKFEAWMSQIRALDEQVKQQMKSRNPNGQ